MDALIIFTSSCPPADGFGMFSTPFVKATGKLLTESAVLGRLSTHKDTCARVHSITESLM